MTDTPQPPTPFAMRLTPEVRAEWVAYEAANRRARDTAAEEATFTGEHRPCRVCGAATKSAARIHNRCLEEA